jgi:hypothetical protein
MSSAAITDELLAPVVAGLGGHAADAARQSGFVVVATSAFGPCTCPGECERDHDNE